MARRRFRHRRAPLLLPQLLPSLVTIIGLCAGLTAIRFAFSGHFAISAALILFAAVIDGLDGLLARRLGSASPFGAELDSLCDFVDFGVAPGILIYQMALADARDLGWVLVLVYTVCCCLRLARFNVTRDAPASGPVPRFVGVPAPAGAMLALLPAFVTIEGPVDAADYPLIVALWLGLVGLMMVSRLPTFSPKALRIPRDRVRWLLIGTAIIVGLGLTRFWLTMILAVAVYIASLIHSAIVTRLGRRG
ncbi:MAG: CDP-diacylglycerol--serine O-phosphatidyltransferase [Amaricoccus sp.]|mgnify:CR=1 FL=1|uniref:CDP-diacylglycerol--serine O-phosphatidyltransferase n=1 Tax=Amaricoccus sp. TaxID=1872485 RepID=UPI003314EDA6